MNARNDDTPVEAGEDWPEFPASGQLAAALAKAQAEMANPAFDKENPHFRSKFASLAAVRNAVIPVLAKHGIAVVQDPRPILGGVPCYTYLLHASGEQLRLGPYTIPVTKNDAQGVASATTYAKRIQLQSVAGVAGEDDDDANAAVGKPAAAQGITAPNGTSFHDPKGDLGKNIDTKTANDWARRLTDNSDNEHRVVEIWDELKSDHDLTVAVWACLSGPIKHKIRDLTGYTTRKAQ